MVSDPKYRFKFSFVMPVYNVEEYLAEAIDSILSQSMDFKDNCEIILVNDGSPDDSEAICLDYKKRYPNNIKYIKQKNAGVSAARNTGIKVVEGEYISFLDSDDMISSDTLQSVYDFFNDHRDEVDVVSIKMKYIDAKTGDHPLNYKYDTNKVIDVNVNFADVQSSIGNTFVRSEVFSEEYLFDTRLRVIEDGKLLTQIILNKMAYGVVVEPVYSYRQRVGEGSAMEGRLKSRSWYIDTPKYAYRETLDYSKTKVGYIPKYVQYFVMYHLQGNFLQASQTVLSGSDLSEYKNDLVDLLQYIDDDIIMAQKKLRPARKIFILSKKHKEAVRDNVVQNGFKFMYRNQKVYDYKRWILSFLVDELVTDEGSAVIKGRLKGSLLGGVKFGWHVSGVFHEAKFIKHPSETIMFLDEVVYEGGYFELRMNIHHGDNMTPVLVTPNDSTIKIDIAQSDTSQAPPFVNGKAFLISGNYIFCRTTEQTIVVVKNTFKSRIMKRMRYEREVKRIESSNL